MSAQSFSLPQPRLSERHLQHHRQSHQPQLKRGTVFHSRSTAQVQPFRLTFRTDGNEVVTATGQNTDDADEVVTAMGQNTEERDNAPCGTVGFKLDYTQISC